MKYLTASIAIVLACLSVHAHAQKSDGDESELRNDTVTVYGSSPERADAFIKSVVPKFVGRKTLARWDESVCVSVAGPPVHQAQYIADRISVAANNVGLKMGGPECSTNLLVIVTTDPNLLVSRLAEDQPQFFGLNEPNSVKTPGKTAFANFLSSTKPVRWWVVTETVGADGIPIDGDAYIGSGKSTTLAGNGVGGKTGTYKNVPVVRSDSTRLSSSVRRDISRVVVIVDARAIGNISLAAISDYIAFVSLAEVDVDADASGFSSILNLFGGIEIAQSLSSGMTDWDRAYLDGLYQAQRDAVSLQRQTRKISEQLVGQ